MSSTKTAEVVAHRDGTYSVRVPSDYQAPDAILSMYTQRYEQHGADYIVADSSDHANRIADAINAA